MKAFFYPVLTQDRPAAGLRLVSANSDRLLLHPVEDRVPETADIKTFLRAGRRPVLGLERGEHMTSTTESQSSTSQSSTVEVSNSFHRSQEKSNAEQLAEQQPVKFVN